MSRNSTTLNDRQSSEKLLFSMVDVKKSFGQNLVLDGINFDLRAGEIHALVGENGAGKSTCFGLLYGLHKPTAGQLFRDGKTITIESPSHAQKIGIGCVFQELSLAGSLSVAENIFAGRAPSKFGIVDSKELNCRAEKLLAEFDLHIDVKQPVDSLPISTRQIVEIAKAMSMDTDILLLDEPTSALTPDEVDGLFVVLRKLAARGIGIVYVSHHMSEIFEISDRVSVLRDGRLIATHQTAQTTQNIIVEQMVGGNHPGNADHKDEQLGDVILDVKNLTNDGFFNDISFSIRRGEILGFAGLLGSRRSEIMRSLVGLMRGHKGEITYKGSKAGFSNLRKAMQAGIGFVPEERKTEGLFLDYTLSDNLVAAHLEHHTKFGFLNGKSILSESNKVIEAFGVKTRGAFEKIGSLSGGNQQKILLAKWLQRQPELLIIEEPTKGVDVGAKFQIHTELQRCAAKGMAVIIISSDFPELLSLSTRIIAVHEGNITGEILACDATENSLLQMAAGLNVEQLSSRSNQAKTIIQEGN